MTMQEKLTNYKKKYGIYLLDKIWIKMCLDTSDAELNSFFQRKQNDNHCSFFNEKGWKFNFSVNFVEKTWKIENLAIFVKILISLKSFLKNFDIEFPTVS
jgi:hypothetical protein